MAATDQRLTNRVPLLLSDEDMERLDAVQDARQTHTRPSRNDVFRALLFEEHQRTARKEPQEG
jgi:hypothetical protein